MTMYYLFWVIAVRIGNEYRKLPKLIHDDDNKWYLLGSKVFQGIMSRQASREQEVKGW